MKLYTKNCPKCIVLKKKLEQKGISFDIESEDFTVITNAGIDTVPVLEIDGKLILFDEAIDWVNNIDERN